MSKPSRTAKKRPAKSHPKADRPFAPGYGIVAPDKGKGVLSWTWVAKKMTPCRTFWLSTIHASHARPHVMPLWGVWVDDAFYFSTGRKSRKGQNLTANSACTIANDNGEEAVIVEGLATQVNDAAVLERVASVYQKKYKMDPRSMGEPIYRVQPRRVFGFVEKTFAQSATRWKL